MVVVPAWLPLATMALSIAASVITVISVAKSVRQRRHCEQKHGPNIVALTFNDDEGDVVAVITSDGAVVVNQPDKILAAGDAFVEHLAEVAARQAAEKEFGSAP
jgi:hypothetical protein